jgi:hypothetical protein
MGYCKKFLTLPQWFEACLETAADSSPDAKFHMEDITAHSLVKACCTLAGWASIKPGDACATQFNNPVSCYCTSKQKVR